MTDEQRLGLPEEPKKISDMACTNHGCIYGHPGGMGTNGGCHCLAEVRDVDDRMQISAAIRRGREAEKWGAAWREKALELEKRVDIEEQQARDTAYHLRMAMEQAVKAERERDELSQKLRELETKISQVRQLVDGARASTASHRLDGFAFILQQIWAVLGSPAKERGEAEC